MQTTTEGTLNAHLKVSVSLKITQRGRIKITHRSENFVLFPVVILSLPSYRCRPYSRRCVSVGYSRQFQQVQSFAYRFIWL